MLSPYPLHPITEEYPEFTASEIEVMRAKGGA
jgi:hypothetical protein